MAVNFDRWTILKLVEVVLAVACLIYKRVTDDEAFRLFLYLQRLSREWGLLHNVTWDRIGAAVADATYGGYVVITIALFFGRLFKEIPTHRRITESLLLGVGAILFIIMGSLEFAALDQVPPDLVDNAAIIGTLTLVEGLLFLLDLGGPRTKKPNQEIRQTEKIIVKQLEPKSITQQVYDIERQIGEPHFTIGEKTKDKHENGEEIKRNGQSSLNGSQKLGYDTKYKQEGYKRMSDDSIPNRFGIYGKDVADSGESGLDEPDDIPPQMETHSPVWSQIRKGQYGKLDILSTSYLHPKEKKIHEGSPSGPGDPGYVQYLAQHWGSKSSQKTPRHSPTEV